MGLHGSLQVAGEVCMILVDGVDITTSNLRMPVLVAVWCCSAFNGRGSLEMQHREQRPSLSQQASDPGTKN